MKVIHNYDEAYQIGKKCIEKMNTMKLQSSQILNALKNNALKNNAPKQIFDKTWEISLSSLEHTLKYVFEKLHHSCYLLCVESTIPTMYKLENRETAPTFSKILEEATDPRKGKVWNNPTLTPRQKQDIINYVKKPVRVMQCVVKEYAKKENDIKQNEYISFFEKEGIKLSNGVYLFNLTDAIILREDGAEPFQMVTGNKPLGKYNFKSHIPIFSMSGQAGYKDIPIPNYDDIELSQKPLPKYITDWTKKKFGKAVFRGGPTGCGYTSETNMRLKLVEMSYQNSKVYDDVDAEIVTKNKFNINSSSIRFDPKYGLGMLNSNIKPGTPMDMAHQSNFKYIIHIDGNVNAYRLLNTMLTGSLILRVDSEYTSWFDHFISFANNSTYNFNNEESIYNAQCFIRIKSDLSNLKDVIEWCRRNDAMCAQIANNALRLAHKLWQPTFMANYMGMLINYVSPDYSPHSPDSPPPYKKNITPIDDSPPYVLPSFPTPPSYHGSPYKDSPPFIPFDMRQPSSKKGETPLPEGMFIKTGKKCPNGSKSHKYKDKMVCKKNVSVKKIKSISPPTTIHITSSSSL